MEIQSLPPYRKLVTIFNNIHSSGDTESKSLNHADQKLKTKKFIRSSIETNNENYNEQKTLKEEENASRDIAVDDTDMSIEKEKTESYNCQRKNTQLVEKPTAFLYKGPMMQLSTSNEGMYGEISENGVLWVAEQMSLFGLDECSVVLDLGSGRGAPSVIFSHYASIFSSIGIEKCEQAFLNSLTVMRTLLERERQAFTLDNKAIDSKYPSRCVGFANEDLSAYDHFDGATHLYSFDAAMEGALINNLVYQFKNTKTAWFYASFRSDLISTFGLPNTKLITKYSVNMCGSGEGRMCYVYVKNNWKEIQKFARSQLLEKVFKCTCIDTEVETTKELHLSKWHQPLSVMDLIKLTKASLAVQIQWYQSQLGKTQLGVLTRSQKDRLWGKHIAERKRQNATRDRLMEGLASGKTAAAIKKARIKLQNVIKNINEEKSIYKCTIENNEMYGSWNMFCSTESTLGGIEEEIDRVSNVMADGIEKKRLRIGEAGIPNSTEQVDVKCNNSIPTSEQLKKKLMSTGVGIATLDTTVKSVSRRDKSSLLPATRSAHSTTVENAIKPIPSVRKQSILKTRFERSEAIAATNLSVKTRMKKLHPINTMVHDAASTVSPQTAVPIDV